MELNSYENCYAMTCGGDYGYKDGTERMTLLACSTESMIRAATMECMGGLISLFRAAYWTTKKYKNNIWHGFRLPPFDILHATTNQKNAGVTEGGRDRMRDWARMLEESVSIVLGLLGASKRDPSKYT